MLELWIAVIVGVINVALMLYCAKFWLHVWRKHHVQSAHAMTISCVFIVVLAAVGVFGTARQLLQDGENIATISLVMSSFTFLYASVQLLFTRGYFSKGEVT